MDLESVYKKTLLMRQAGIEECYCASICLMFQCGCRISSILRLRPCHITKDGRVMLHQGKGSMPMVVYPVYYREYWAELANSGTSPFEYQNYTYYYRLFQRFSLVEGFNFGNNRAITATARKSLAHDVFDASGDLEMTATALGHRNIESTTYYTSDKAGRMRIKKGVLDTPQGLIERIQVCKNGIIRIKKNI